MTTAWEKYHFLKDSIPKSIILSLLFEKKKEQEEERVFFFFRQTQNFYFESLGCVHSWKSTQQIFFTRSNSQQNPTIEKSILYLSKQKSHYVHI